MAPKEMEEEKEKIMTWKSLSFARARFQGQGYYFQVISFILQDVFCILQE
jgi:hypothetical protein